MCRAVLCIGHGASSASPCASRLLTYFLTHPNRGDSLWQAFAGRSPGGGLQCLRRSHPHPTRAPGLSTALLSLTDALGNAITHREPFLQRRRHRHHCHFPGGHVRLCLLLNQRFCDCDCRSCMGWCHRACWEKRLFFSPRASSDALQFFAKCVINLGCRHDVVVEYYCDRDSCRVLGMSPTFFVWRGAC